MNGLVEWKNERKNGMMGGSSREGVEKWMPKEICSLLTGVIHLVLAFLPLAIIKLAREPVRVFCHNFSPCCIIQLRGSYFWSDMCCCWKPTTWGEVRGRRKAPSWGCFFFFLFLEGGLHTAFRPFTFMSSCTYLEWASNMVAALEYTRRGSKT